MLATGLCDGPAGNVLSAEVITTGTKTLAVARKVNTTTTATVRSGAYLLDLPVFESRRHAQGKPRVTRREDTCGYAKCWHTARSLR